jgi:CubicO group peptidase (beta-lactamase class C family)
MLLGHRSGIYDNLIDLLKINELNGNPLQWVKDHLTTEGKYYTKDYWSTFEPGTKCSYSSFAFVVLSALVEQITGENFDDFCQKKIFTPLQMTSTSFVIENLDKNQFARPYFPSIFGYIPFIHYDGKVLAACGGLRTNAVDLAHFLIAHMNNGVYKNIRILENSTVELMHTLYDEEDTGSWFHGGIIKFGLGWAHLEINGKHWEGYNGGAVGYSCDMTMIQSERAGVIILSNNHFYRFMTKIYDRYQWHDLLATHLLKKAK